jgi:hypothetical protein
VSDLFARAWIRAVVALRRDEGQAVTEYAVVLALVAAIAAAITATGLGAAIVNGVTTELGKISF